MPSINSIHKLPGRAMGRRLADAVDLAYRWLERAEQRRRLYALEPRTRQDLAMSGADIEREARKAFWQA